jgi:phosphoribosylanthranilate isomerase
MNTKAHPFLVSITGADDAVDPRRLVELSEEYPFVEWGILHLPHKEGTPRNPTSGWRWKLAQARNARAGGQPAVRTALHLCSDDVFSAILAGTESPTLLAELAQYDRVQLNINARRMTFEPSEIVKLYEALRWLGIPIIMQAHEGTEAGIRRFVSQVARTQVDSPWLLRLSLAAIDKGDIAILLDNSKGKGVAPEGWRAPVSQAGHPLHTGYAGGISPDNIEAVLDATQRAVENSGNAAHPYWLDMESGVRTGNRFDLGKVVRVLKAVAERAVVAPAAQPA